MLYEVITNQYVDIKDLNVWDVVDKAFLLKLLWNQPSLWEKKDEMFFWNPAKYFTNFKNPIDQDELDTINVITSYSIHYTKLYEYMWRGLWLLDLIQEWNVWLFRAVDKFDVITSYSIHYTKLYE